MTDTGSPLRRPVGARSVVLGLLGLGILGCAAWLAYRQAQGMPGAADPGTPPVTPAAVVRTGDAAVAPGAVPAPPSQAEPAAGTQHAAPQDAPPQRPSFDIVRVAPDGGAVVAGRAAPDADVALLDNGREIGRARADDRGQFVVIPDQPLPAGGQQLALQSGQPGTAPVEGDAPAVLVVPERPAGPAAGGTPAHDAPAGTAVAVLTPPEGAPRLLTVPSEPAGAPGQVALRVVDYDAQGAIRFAGTARPGTSVRVYIDNLPVGEAVADAAGHWGMVPDSPVPAGAHRLRADELGARGQVLSRAELPFRRDAVTPGDLHGGQVVVQPRQTLWRIARHVYGQGMRFTVIYDANREQIRDPNRIYPGQVFALPSHTAAASGGP